MSEVEAPVATNEEAVEPIKEEETKPVELTPEQIEANEKAVAAQKEAEARVARLNVIMRAVIDTLVLQDASIGDMILVCQELPRSAEAIFHTSAKVKDFAPSA
jgi:hypothetical protein